MKPVAVKICGVTAPEEAVLCAELGATYLGLNFWPGSPRCLDLGRAREIAAAVKAAAPDVLLVGVFVNPEAAAVTATAGEVGLDLLQFSGDEPAVALRPFDARALKALRAHDPETAAAYADCWGVLFDTPAAGGYGGTGRTWDYAAAAAAGAGFARVFIAGGISPRNVRQVIALVRPFAVDVCSGVESAPGRKDPRLLRQLFEEVSNGQASRPA